MNKPSFVYVTYIRTTPEKIWEAITDREISAQYWGGPHRNVSDWNVGSKWEHQRADGSNVIDIVGTVTETDRPRRLASVEAILDGQVIDEATIAKAEAATHTAVDPQDDIHASAAYRRALVGTMVERALKHAAM